MTVGKLLIPTSEVVNLLKLSFHELEKLNPNGLTGQFFCPLELLRESHHVCPMWLFSMLAFVVEHPENGYLQNHTEDQEQMHYYALKSIGQLLIALSVTP